MGLLTMFTSCESLDQAPEDFFASGNFWKDQPQVSGYMTGLHRYLRSSYGIHFTMGELRGGLLGDGDDGSGVSVFGESMYNQTIIKQDLRADNALFNNWDGLYGEIVRVNLALQQIPECTFLTDAQKKPLPGTGLWHAGLLLFLPLPHMGRRATGHRRGHH